MHRFKIADYTYVSAQPGVVRSIEPLGNRKLCYVETFGILDCNLIPDTAQAMCTED